MERTLIQIHTSALIKGLIERTQSIKNLEHKTLKGELREIFISNLIKNFLPSNIEVGSGVIVNQKGDGTDTQIDLIIYDTSFLPPFVKEYNLGIFPAESVLAIVEVRSWLDKGVLKDMDSRALNIFSIVYNRNASLYPEYTLFKPFFTVFGYYSKTEYKEEKKKELRDWIWENCKNIDAICLLNKFSWFNLGREKGKNHLKLKDEFNEETKSFIGLLLDNIVTRTRARDYAISGHRDYYGVYIRDQKKIRKIFDTRKRAR